MKKISIIVIVVLLLLSGYIFAKDMQIKKELKLVGRSEFVETTGEQNQNEVASEITAIKKDGAWTVSETGEFTLDPDSLTLEFTGYKPGGQHIGTFNEASVRISLDEAGVPVESIIVLEVASVETDTEAVDKHLQAPEFFDAQNSPQIRVVIKGVENRQDTSFMAIAEISMSGETRTLAIPVQTTEMDNGMRFEVDTKIKISEYGMAYGPVQDDVRVMVSGVLKRK